MRIPKWIIFNFITNDSLRSLEKFPYLNKRLKSMCLDLMYIFAIYFPWIIISVPIFILSRNIEKLKFFISLVEGIIIIFSILNKDLCNGRSIAKRILGFQIIDVKTNKVASDYKCMLRNITIIIFPLEVVVALLNKERRIGDLLAGTKLLECDSEAKETFLSDMSEKKQLSSRLLIVSFVTAIIISMWLNNGFWY